MAHDILQGETWNGKAQIMTGEGESEMKNIQGIQLIMESNEELLPGFFMDFPYICSCVEFDKYIDPGLK